jgi:hypothetical protein
VVSGGRLYVSGASQEIEVVDQFRLATTTGILGQFSP